MQKNQLLENEIYNVIYIKSLIINKINSKNIVILDLIKPLIFSDFCY